MNALLTISSIYYSFEGEIWCTHSYNEEMWNEYLENYKSITIYAPIKNVNILPHGCKKASGKDVYFINSTKLKYISDIIKYFKSRKKTYNYIKNYIDVGILHSPSLQAIVMYKFLKKLNIPFVVESRGEQMMNVQFLKARKVPFHKIVAKFTEKIFIKHLENSYGCIYVSKTLMEKYKPKKQIISEVISDLRMDESLFLNDKKSFNINNTLKFITVGTLNECKDHITLIKCMNELKRYKIEDWQLNIVGCGPQENILKEKVKEYNLQSKIIFHGFIEWGEELFKLYDESDLFILTSLTEGMPRVILESMARGVPVISTNVPGAIELLPREYIVDIKDYKKLAEVIKDIYYNREKLYLLSKGSEEVIRGFNKQTLKIKKNNYFRQFNEWYLKNEER